MHIQWKKIITLTLTALALTAVLAGCGSTQNSSAEKKEITVGVNPGSGEQIMEQVAKVAEKDGLTVKVKVFSDYITPDKALADGDIDLNSYQHVPFLNTFNEKMAPTLSQSAIRISHRLPSTPTAIPISKTCRTVPVSPSPMTQITAAGLSCS